MKKGILSIFLIMGMGILLSGCTTDGLTEATTQEKVEQNQQKLEKARPLPQLGDSLERRNIINRLELWNKDDKVSYIYLINYGKVMSFYTIKGKITSGSKRLTSNEKKEECDTGEWTGDCVMESPSLDGTYGGSDDYIYFWTTEGNYVQWSSDYMLADQPLKLTQQPELVREIK